MSRARVWECFCVEVLVTAGLLTALGCSTDASWQQKRRMALDRPREVIYNNDGNEPVLWPTNQPFSIGAFLQMPLRQWKYLSLWKEIQSCR